MRFFVPTRRWRLRIAICLLLFVDLSLLPLSSISVSAQNLAAVTTANLSVESTEYKTTPVRPPTRCAGSSSSVTLSQDWGLHASEPFSDSGRLAKAGECARKVWTQFQEANFQCASLHNSAAAKSLAPLSGCHSERGPCFDGRDECISAVFSRDFRETFSAYAGRYSASGSTLWGYLPSSNYNPVDQGDPLCLDPSCNYKINRSGKVYFNERCEEVPGPPSGLACAAGEMEFNLSPVSLIWEKGTDVDSEMNLARFKMMADNQERWVLWKASSKAPLIVYDPEHMGQITSGAQLFGNWALGGKAAASASKPIRLDTIVQSEEWRNGYESLRVMDTDKDRKLSGDELTPLALWFDKNRDAISQPGEVVRMSDAGVTEIFYEGYMSDGLQNTLRLKKGYTREMAGSAKPIVGESVDWYTDSSIEPGTLIQKITSQSIKTPLGAASTYSDLDSVDAQASDTILRDGEILPLNQDPRKNLGGLWFWQIMDGKNEEVEEKHGAFTISDANDGRIRGHTWGFKYFKTPQGDASQVLQSAVIEGVKKRSGSVTVEFGILRGKAYDYSIRSNAVLSPDGMALEGYSVASFRVGEKKVNATYRWVARRFLTNDSRMAVAMHMRG